MSKANRDYAVNPLKLQRAVDNATIEAHREGKEIDENKVKELYISYGGKLQIVDEDAPETEEETPKKKGKKSSAE